MRDILFRAKRTDNGEWVYGYYIKTHDYLDNREIHLIVGIDSTSFPTNEVTDVNEVNLETLGQYTGLTDKNGVKIFKGDIVKLEGDGKYTGTDIYTVEYELGAFYLCYDNRLARFLRHYNDYAEVIGNVYDNSELLEDKK